MNSSRSRALLTVVALLFLITVMPPSVLATDLSKLDTLARVTYAMIAGGASPSELLEAGKSANESGQLEAFVVGSVTRTELENLGTVVLSEDTGLFTAYFPTLSIVDSVTDLSGVQRVDGAPQIQEELNVSLVRTGIANVRGAGPNFLGANGQGVLVGMVDTGVDYHHDDFKTAAGATRLVNIWDQSDNGANPGPPAGFNYGAEWAPAAINNATARERDTSEHGSHVLGIAGGDGSAAGGGSPPAFTFAGVAPRADLIVVKLSSPFNLLATRVIDGARYISRRATALTQPCVLNLSLGTQYGPHDGTSDFERGLSKLTGQGRIIVKSAGNDRGKDVHAEALAVAAGVTITLTVGGAVQPPNARVAIDGYYNAPGTVSIAVKPPTDVLQAAVAFNAENAPFPGVATNDGFLYVSNGRALTSTGARQVYIELINNPGGGTNINGVWEFTFTRTGGPAQIEVDLWKFHSFPSGPPPVPTVTARFVMGLDTDEIITEPGNADSLITVAAWATKRQWTDCNANANATTQVVGRLASFSSPGPTRDDRIKPDITAPGSIIASSLSMDGLPVCPAAGAQSFHLTGLRHTMKQGTSMAAPHVSGACALLLQQDATLTPAAIKKAFRLHAVVDDSTGAVPNKDWGNGKMFAEGLLVVAVEPAASTAPHTTHLDQNVPNPFNPATTITYGLARREQVSLKLYDSAGREVAELVNEEQPAGKWRVTFDGSALASGVYYYRLETNGFSDTRKITLIK